MRNVFTILLRFITLWVFNGACLLVCNWLLPGLSILTDQQMPAMVSAMSVSLVFSLLNLLIRPLLLLLTIPLTGLTSGMFSLFINAFILFLVAFFTDLFTIDSIWTGFLAGFLFALTNIVLTALFPIDDDLLYFDFLGERIKKQTRIQDDGKKGIIVLEIDGLSYKRLMKAVTKRQMPFLKELLDSGHYQIDEFDCGIPSQTSSCQAGIMFGSNHDICAYRWYDKRLKKVISSGSFQDAGWMEKRIIEEKPGGLLEGGVSINNLMSGNASEALLTVSSMIPKSNEELVSRNIDVYLFSVKPYLLTKSIIFTIADITVEIFQYSWARIRGKTPRLNRLRRFYPLIRGVTNVLLRDISTALIIDDIYRGRPAIYATFYGHDEIAHHSGPDSYEAMHALVGIDRSIKKISHAAQTEAGRDYDLFVISDHGQSFGTTFKQRYGYSLSTFIRKLAHECTVEKAAALVTGIENSADNDASIRAALYTLQSSSRQQAKPFSSQAFSHIEKAIDKNESREIIDRLQSQDSDIWVLASGNLVNVYFSFSDQKTQLSEIEQHYTNLCARLIDHPGVGVIVLQDEGHPVVIGKNGARDLLNGSITGDDPLVLYGSVDKRAAQLLYLSQFPSGGDIIVFSTVYPDGTIASFEELIGSHGGMGGEQTSPFIFHPLSVEIPDDITNSTQIFDVLHNSRTRLSEKKSLPGNGRESAAESSGNWNFQHMVAGIKNTKNWTPLLRDVVLFQPAAFRKIGNDPSMNGPALLLFGISLFSNMLVWMLIPDFNQYGLFFGLISWGTNWFILAAAVYSSTLMLREKGNEQQLIRGLMFCSIFDLLWFGALIPGYAYFWFVLILLTRLISVSTAISGISNVQGKKKLIIIPSVFCLQILIGLLIFIVTESIAYIFNIASLKQITEFIRINLVQP